MEHWIRNLKDFRKHLCVCVCICLLEKRESQLTRILTSIKALCTSVLLRTMSSFQCDLFLLTLSCWAWSLNIARLLSSCNFFPQRRFFFPSGRQAIRRLLCISIPARQPLQVRYIPHSFTVSTRYHTVVWAILIFLVWYWKRKACSLFPISCSVVIHHLYVHYFTFSALFVLPFLAVSRSSSTDTVASLLYNC